VSQREAYISRRMSELLNDNAVLNKFHNNIQQMLLSQLEGKTKSSSSTKPK
jgi:hypothetical protein